jgi:two-component system, OmpR family, sensor kinase
MKKPTMTEEDLVRSNEELRAAVRARDEFLAVAAHELRSPMHALLLQMTSVVEVARRGGDEDLVRRLERVKQVVERYVRRATTLLEVSRISAGQLKLRLEDVDFAQIVRDTKEAYAAEATYHGSQVEVVAPNVLRGWWDHVALEQIVTNLLVNAIKYGDGKPILITLSNEDAWARLEVRDQGIGISLVDQERVFERFEQAVGARSHGGFGVGLWLTRSLVEAHRGSIAIESAPRNGATFTVRLPIGPAETI